MIPITISLECWDSTIQGLRTRSRKGLESTCVLAGVRTQQAHVVSKPFFLDDFMGVTRGPRLYRVPREAVKILFDQLHDQKLKIIADVHTHPEDWVELSDTDREHPLEFRIGFVSIILPWYGRPSRNITEIGFHEYVGSGTWRRWRKTEICKRFCVGGSSV